MILSFKLLQRLITLNLLLLQFLNQRRQLVDFLPISFLVLKRETLLKSFVLNLVDLDLFEYFFGHFLEFEVDLLALYVNFFDELVVLTGFEFFLVE